VTVDRHRGDALSSRREFDTPKEPGRGNLLELRADASVQILDEDLGPRPKPDPEEAPVTK